MPFIIIFGVQHRDRVRSRRWRCCLTVALRCVVWFFRTKIIASTLGGWNMIWLIPIRFIYCASEFGSFEFDCLDYIYLSWWYYVLRVKCKAANENTTKWQKRYHQYSTWYLVFQSNDKVHKFRWTLIGIQQPIDISYYRTEEKLLIAKWQVEREAPHAARDR